MGGEYRKTSHTAGGVLSQLRVGAAIVDSDARTTFWNRSGLGRAPAAYFPSTRARAIEPVAAAFLDAPSDRG